MIYLNENSFISRFKPSNDYKNNLSSFKKHARVKTGNNELIPLTVYLNRKNSKTTNNEIIKIVYYKLIQNKQSILSNFYNKSLRIQPEYNHTTLNKYNPMPLSSLSNTKYPQFKNEVRNIHYLGILKNTTSDIPNVRTYLSVLEDLFKHWIIDYKLITPSAIHYFQQDVIGSILSAFTFRASVMNPYLVYSILSRLSKSMNLKSLSLFTPTLGWSSYLVGASALSIPLVRYTGIDVLPNVCKKTAKYAKQITPQTKTSIYCNPSENFNVTKTHRNQYDIVFFSPPYYKLEQYEQVMDKYNTFEEWYTEYWIPTINVCSHVLRKKGRLAFILSLYSEYDDNLSKMTKLPRAFRKIKKYPIHNSKTMKQTTNTEFLYIYEKV